MSGYEILKVLENLDREYLTQAKSSDGISTKKFATSAHFVIINVRREFIKELKKKSV